MAFRARHHTTVEFLTGKLSPRWKISFAVGIDLLILVAAVVVGYVSLDLLSISATSNTTILQINAAWLILPLTVGLALVALFVIERLVYAYPPRAVVPAACVVALLVAIVYAISAAPSLHLGNGTALGVIRAAIEQVLRAGQLGAKLRRASPMPVDLGGIVEGCLTLARSRHHLPADALTATIRQARRSPAVKPTS